MKPNTYTSRTSVIIAANRAGHVVLSENNRVTIDTGVEVFYVGDNDIKDKNNETVTAEDAMKAVKAQHKE